MTTKKQIESIDFMNLDRTSDISRPTLGQTFSTPTKIVYTVQPHFHPFAERLMTTLSKKTVADMLAEDTDGQFGPADEFKDQHQPHGSVIGPYPQRVYDFDEGGAYAVYNWELFFHAPLALAIHLSRNQRYEEAMQWFHYVFDPTTYEAVTSDTAAPYWKFPVFKSDKLELVGDVMTALSNPADATKYEKAFKAVEAWRSSPFQPHAVARKRPTAYMLHTVMAYIDNLIDWGDSLFRQDTRETISEAMQHYVLAAMLLGQRPQAVPKRDLGKDMTYADLRRNLDAFSNASREMEAAMPSSKMVYRPIALWNPKAVATRSLSRSLYFGIPANDRLMDYWDRVADRLFKIRNSLNFDGVFRQLALFAPPIDPGMIAAGLAAGIDIGALTRGDGLDRPLVRFPVLFQKAMELCQEVKSLGSHFLSAMEKEDAEALAIMRQKHETAVLDLVESVRYQQWQEAIKAREGAELALDNAVERWTHYGKLLGKSDEELKFPELEPLDKDGLLTKAFQSADAKLALDTIKYSGSELNKEEEDQLYHMKWASDQTLAATAVDAGAALLTLIPDLNVTVSPFGCGADSEVTGGGKLSQAAAFGAKVLHGFAGESSYWGTVKGIQAGHKRRSQEWSFARNTAIGEINQSIKQVRSAQIRECIAETELNNHRKQMAFAKEIQDFFSGENKKKTNKELYGWMRTEVKSLYSRCYSLALEVARKAEQALRYELGDLNPLKRNYTFIQPRSLTGHEGLLVGENLYLELKQMETTYLDKNKRQHEMTRHVSLLQLAPDALIQLRQMGKCSFELPEILFDMDCPGHYFRRIKSMALSVPCVTGTYTTINCKLTQTGERIRIKEDADDSYGSTGENGDRFASGTTVYDAIVTSTGVNDSGMFETNLHDERYLPFEGTGAVSDWTLELLGKPKRFDYSTISDVILHVRYTAMIDSTLKETVETYLDKELPQASRTRLFSLRSEFPNEWARLKNAPASGVTIKLKEEHYPFWFNVLGNIEDARLIVRASAGTTTSGWTANGKSVPLTQFTVGEDKVDDVYEATLPPPSAKTWDLPLTAGDSKFEDVWLAVTLREKT